jgi:F-type H+-transporting ATPase subunit delta
VATQSYAKRYARAVYEIALEQNEPDRWQADLRRIAVLGEDEALRVLLASPKLSFEDKMAMIEPQLSGVSPMARNLASLLIARNKINLTSGIATQYQALLDKARGIERAEVTTAIPLDDQAKDRVQKALSALVGKTVIVENKVDAGIIGGIVARIDGKLLEGSTRNRLAALNKELAGVER